MKTWRCLGLLGLFVCLQAELSGCSEDVRSEAPDRFCNDAGCYLGTVPTVHGSPIDAGGVTLDAATASDAAVAPGAVVDATSVVGSTPWVAAPIRPTRYRIPDPVVLLPPCSAAGSGAISAHEVLAGQTHLTPAGWPFQTVSANRPLTIAVAAQGTGAAPSFVATARLAGKQFSICLVGPSTLPADRANLEASSYRGSLPAAWVQPGLQIEVTFGGRSELLAPDVKPENGLTLYLVRAQLFGTGSVQETSAAYVTRRPARTVCPKRAAARAWCGIQRARA